MTKKDYLDKDGIRRRVAVMNATDSPEEGIPLDVYWDLDEFYQDLPDTFRKNFYSRLWDMGLIEAQDFLAKDAANKYRTALQLTLKSDATDVIRFITSLNLETKDHASHFRHA